MITIETAINYTDKTAFFSSDERKWISRIQKLAEQHPDSVTILYLPEQNDGCIYCKIPAEWVKVAPKRKVVLSDEQLQASRERAKLMNERRSQNVANNIGNQNTSKIGNQNMSKG